MEFPKTTTVVPGGEQVNFAWMLAAGVAKSPGERVTLNLAWRYTDSGTVETRWSSTLPKPERICRIMDFEYLCTTCSEADM